MQINAHHCLFWETQVSIPAMLLKLAEILVCYEDKMGVKRMMEVVLGHQWEERLGMVGLPEIQQQAQGHCVISWMEGHFIVYFNSRCGLYRICYFGQKLQYGEGARNAAKMAPLPLLMIPLVGVGKHQESACAELPSEHSVQCKKAVCVCKAELFLSFSPSPLSTTEKC